MGQKALLLEFNFRRHDAVSILARRVGCFAEAKSKGVEGDGLFEFETILHGLRWACGLGADLI
jgi:hypothetical protein